MESVSQLTQWAWLIPLYGGMAALLSLPWSLGLLKGQKSAAFAGIAAMAVAFGHSLFALLASLGSPEPYRLSLSWLNAGDVHLDLTLLFTPLTLGMLTLVTGISFLVQIYSLSYMAAEGGLPRYYGLLNFFTAAMLGLVISDNLLITYACWELMGLCSYLLVGFWFHKASATQAARKAFLTTRVGDFLLLVGIVALYVTAGTLDFAALGIWAETAQLAPAFAAFLTLLLFAGPVGKSAQFPLHVWLPDAMEGPTPVSALIHAATMVAAGVFLVVKLEPVFALSPFTMGFIAWTGAVTALGSALIALVQNDIKRVLAYSTISQLGYMFMALGAGHPEAAVFHLFTHAFFKAMLFLGSGSVIHAMHEAEHQTHSHLDVQDMRYMGGLLGRMPITATTFGLGVLSIAGVFPLAGFWSKDSVLHALQEATEQSPQFSGVYLVALVTACLTAFYMSRQFFLTFTGKARTPEAASVHESPWLMTLPLAVLAVPSGIAGFLGNAWFVKEELSLSLLTLSTAVVALGFTASFLLYGVKIPTGGMSKVLAPIHTALENRLYLDALYERTVVAGTVQLGALFAWFDRTIVDGLVNAISTLTWAGAETLKYLENGKAQVYLLVVMASVLTLGLLSYTVQAGSLPGL
ncbi:NADH-quinone oxidoreductase subunit L [Anthocerotibacter panamensis]|uniref:NADH-quinone oxidoreductase subunit L n=1 Tax=Anthocerotibacter panamensis TaxID=2857077 RepID=UPI00247A96A5|nr:NADH-quinone oxidoreductase subunit L [Anthocerotibacter panamensis]